MALPVTQRGGPFSSCGRTLRVRQQEFSGEASQEFEFLDRWYRLMTKTSAAIMTANQMMISKVPKPDPRAVNTPKKIARIKMICATSDIIWASLL
ncbi:hypothetical protein GCM10018785_45020 [Streptomyces longispororuber]|uniref:Uncharacterized protein n=1 Tax=Streptomyces longispororuber TaxID=68230 RepID=A0A919DRA4_9ACTN|nr:hypothetical protein GCM10018785_45020 [Streptomyces longispororuber]